MADPDRFGAPDPPETPPAARARVCVGKVGAAHGVRGEVRLWSFTQVPDAVARYGALTTADGRAIEIAGMRLQGEFFVARLKGVTDRNAAEALRNVELYIDREKLPPPAPDEFYLADLIGLAAFDPAGRAIGRIVAMHDFGAGDVMELRLDGETDTRMVAFTAASAPSVDVALGRIVIVLPTEIDGDADARDDGPREGAA